MSNSFIVNAFLKLYTIIGGYYENSCIHKIVAYFYRVSSSSFIVNFFKFVLMKEENSKLRANSVFFAIFDKTVAAINGLAQKIFNYFKNISGSSVICRFVNILLPKSIGGAFNSVSVILSGFFLLRLIILTIMHGPALNILTLNGGLALVFAAGALTPMENMGYAIKDSILAKLIEWFFVEE